MKKLVFLTLMAFLFSITAYSQQPKHKAKATTVHPVNKTAVKKPTVKSSLPKELQNDPYYNRYIVVRGKRVDTYAGYKTLEEANEAFRYNASTPDGEGVAIKMLKKGYMPMTIRQPSGQKYSEKQKAEMYKNQNSSPFGGRHTNNPIMY